MIPFFGVPEEPVPSEVPAPLFTDEEIVVCAAQCLRAALSRTDYEIAVRVQNGVIMLNGVVATVDARTLAHRVVWALPAVRDVSNRLTVGPGATPDVP